MSDDTERPEERVRELEQQVERLEAANTELRRTNARLAADRLPRLDSAAASALHSGGAAGPGPRRRVKTRVKSGLRAVALRILR